MSRNFLYSLSILALLGVVGVREWLTRAEIEKTRTNLLDQVKESIGQALTLDRLAELEKSSIVYDRYLEPIVLASSRLLFPGSQTSILQDWKRDLYSNLDNEMHQKRAALQEETKQDLLKVRNDLSPSIDRLLRLSKTSESANLCAQTVSEEIQSLRQWSQDKDSSTLQSLQQEGKQKLRLLKDRIRRMNAAQFGEFLTSGKFVKDYQEPILNIVFTIRNEEMRKNTWVSFQKEMLETLSRKKAQMKEDRKREIINRAFEPLAEVLAPKRLESSAEKKSTPPQNPSGSASDLYQ